MSLSENYVPVKLLGNGVTTQFTANFSVLAPSYMRVYLEDVMTGVQTLQVLNTAYTLAFTGNTLTVTFQPGFIPTSANYVVLARSVTQDQTSAYSTAKGFQGQNQETSFDKLTAITQDLRDAVNRSLKAPIGSGLNLSLPTPVSGKALVGNSTNTGYVNSTYSVDDAISTATAQAVIATNQATAAVGAAGTATTQAGLATAAASAAQAAAAGIKWKNSVRAATTGALPSCTYNNGSAGVGATLTATANGALAAQDGVTLTAGQDLLVKNQVSGLQNGLYTVTQLGGAGSPFTLTRRTDLDQWAEVPSATVGIEEGTTLQDQIWICTSNQGGTVGTTAITFIVYAGGGSSITADKFSGNASNKIFTMSGAPASDAATSVYISGVRQTPTTDYTVSGTTLTFTNAPATGTNNILVVYGTTQAVNVPATGSVQYSTLAASILSTLSDLILGTASKIIDAATFKSWADAKLGQWQSANTSVAGSPNSFVINVPANALEIEVEFYRITSTDSTNSASGDFILQLKDTAYVTSGYSSGYSLSGTAGANRTDGMVIMSGSGQTGFSNKITNFSVRLFRADKTNNRWSMTMSGDASGATGCAVAHGNVTLSAGLTELTFRIANNAALTNTGSYNYRMRTEW